MFELHNISKTYVGNSKRPIAVLQGVDLQINAGRFAAITGPSGCGKSTLLLIAGSLLTPDAGSVVLDGKTLSDMADSQKAKERANCIGFVFQRFHLLPYLTVRENILSARVGLRHAGPADDSRVNELMIRFGIDHRGGHTPDRLSVGEMQRTALARALYNRPKLLLADEPVGNLDPENAEIVFQCFSEFTDSGGAVLMVTHNPSDACRAGDAWHLHDGVLTRA